MHETALTDGPLMISREELYQQVWQEPMTKLAPRYGLSDVGLAKVCRKHHIPRPPVGYWAKAGVGHHVEQTPLPELDDESLKEVRFFRQQFFGVAAQGADSQQQKLAVLVPERLSNPHSLVAQAKEALKAGPSTERAPGKCLDIAVAPASLPRALRIFDAIIKAWEELGGRASVDQDSNGITKTKFAIGKDSVSVSMTEETELVDDGRNDSRYWRYGNRKHNGRLVLEIVGRWADDLRRRWADGKKQRLENVLGSFITGLKKWIEHEMECRLDVECETHQRRRAEEVRKESEEREERLEQRRRNLEACAEHWQKSQQLRSYLAALESTIENRILRPTDPERFPEWLNWAKWYADFLDPLTPTPHREDYLKPPTNLKADELDLTRHTKRIVQALGVEDADALSRVDRKTVYAASERHGWGAWSEIGRVLEGLGYDVSTRERGYI